MKCCDISETYNAIDIFGRNLPHNENKLALISAAVSCTDQNKQMVYQERTFLEVSKEINQVGNALKKLKVKTGDIVGLIMEDSIELVTTFFAIIKIGAVATCLNTLMQQDEYIKVINDAHVRILFLQDTIYKTLEHKLQLLPLECIILVGQDNIKDLIYYRDLIKDEAHELPTVVTNRNDFCSLHYSSGTTGEPKGMFHMHKDYLLAAHLWGKEVLGISGNDRTFSTSKLSFMFGLCGNLVCAWYVGASVIIFSGASKVSKDIFTIISTKKPTVFFSVPTSYNAMLRDRLEEFDLSSIRLCVSAGEALPEQVGIQWKQKTGVDVLDGVGSTETMLDFICNRPGDNKYGSSGKPVVGCEIKIVNDDGLLAKAGEIGNLLVKCDTTSIFYLHKYEETKKVFLGEWFFTGDKCYTDSEGYCYFCGRSDDMFKVCGLWVSPFEVENTLLTHPDILECGVVAAKDREGLFKAKAFVVLKEGLPLSSQLEKELIEYCRSRLASHKCPKWIEALSWLPKTSTNKIKRFALRDQKDFFSKI